MKPYKTTAHIYSLNGKIEEIIVLDKDDEENIYIVNYKGTICKAIFNYFSCSFYADDIYEIINDYEKA